MNFFEQQAKTKRRTTLLLLYFIAAIAGMIAVGYTVVVFSMHQLALHELKLQGGEPLDFMWWNPRVFSAVAGVLLLIIFLGSLFKWVELLGGGTKVALMLGGRLVPPQTRDPELRRLLNVVEEMALASGISVPQTFVLPHQGINAFAAGFASTDAVVGVTEGCLKLLSRNELQGVVAHEFSHIVNGDMKLNFQLISLLFGLELLGLLGLKTMGAVFEVSKRSLSRQSEGGRSDSWALLVFVFGLLVTMVGYLLGYIGLFFGRIIRSAVSRQREYLADASAVQFTRNPDGIVGALKKIGGIQGEIPAKLHAYNELSHMMFAADFTSWISYLFSTHPPLDKRIRAIDPRFDGKYVKVRVSESLPSWRAQVAAPNALQAISFGDGLLEQIPAPLIELARDPFSARAIVQALLLERQQPAVREKQLRWLQANSSAELFRWVEQVEKWLESLTPGMALPILALSLPALRLLSPSQTNELFQSINFLIRSDGKISIFEYSLHTIVKTRLVRSSHPKAGNPILYYGLGGLVPECNIVLSAVCHAGGATAEGAFAAFSRGASHLVATTKLKQHLSLLNSQDFTFKQFDRAMAKLARASVPLKNRLLEATEAAITHDGEIRAAEAELLRAIGELLGMPRVPILGKLPPLTSKTFL